MTFKGSFMPEKFMQFKKDFKSLSWVENLNMLFTIMGGKLKFSAQDSDLEYFFEPHQTFWQKATFRKHELQ